MNRSASLAGTARNIGDRHQRKSQLHTALVVLVLVAPLPFGAYPTWAWASLSLGCGILLCGWGFSVLSRRISFVAPHHLVWWSGVVFGLSLLWGFIQTVGFTPESWHHPIWSGAEQALGISSLGAISIDPKAGRDSLLRMTTYVGIFWLAFQYCRDSKRTFFTLQAVAICIAFYAIYGLAVLFLGSDRILWFEKSIYTDVVTSTFVNPNSFATYCGIGLLCSTSLLMKHFRIGTEDKVGIVEYSRFVFVEFIPRNALILIAWSMMASALLLSLSRAATVATGLALVAMYLVLLTRQKISLHKLLFRLFGVVSAGCLMMFVAGQDLVQKFWKTGVDFPLRAEIYSQTLMAIEHRPILGTGLGTFASVYRSYRTEDIRPGVTKAHNDYLEMFLELGIPAGALLILPIVLLAGFCLHGVWVRRRNYEYPALGFAVCVLVGAHSLVDFSMQIPAVAATFALLLGMAVTQSQSTGGGGEDLKTEVISDQNMLEMATQNSDHLLG